MQPNHNSISISCPTTLYILRMNAKGTDVEIEEILLDKYPHLKSRFCKPYDNNTYSYPIVKLIDKYVGGERIVNYNTNKQFMEREMCNTQKTLRYYHESVAKTQKYLQDLGYEEIRKEENYDNIDVCSIANTFYLYGKPFVLLKFRLGYFFKTDTILVAHDLPCWQIDFLHPMTDVSVHENNTLRSEKKNVGEWLDIITKMPADINSQKEEIVETINEVYGIAVPKADILYDLAHKSYILKQQSEKLLIKDLLPQKDEELDLIAKYTTFDTLISILQSGKIRMNSVVSMNDKTETDFLENVYRNYKEEYEREIDKYLFADKNFITSFTKRIDELDMWRLYGDNAKGVCMVFKRINKGEDELYKIKYIDPGKDLSQIEQLMNALKDINIRFTLNLLKSCRHFIKHSDYIAEAEYRKLAYSNKPDGWFVNRDNGILTPYLERDLKEVNNVEYPFRLYKIIVGPAFVAKEANMMQLFYMSYHCGLLLEIANSNSNSYR